jgi:hypothetical protein
MEAIQTASWGMGTIQVESDSAILINALQCSEYDLAPEGVLFREMRIFIGLNFVSFKIAHVGRDCNNAAHCLAAIGSNQNEVRLIWPDYVPDIVNVVVASELALGSQYNGIGVFLVKKNYSPPTNMMEYSI